MRNPLSRCITIFVALVLTATSVGAERPSLDQSFSEAQAAAQRTWHDRIYPSFYQVADRRTRAALQHVRFRVGEYADINAWAILQQKEILIPYGLLFAIDGVADAEMLVHVEPRCTAILKPFLEKVADAYQTSFATHRWPGVNFAEMCGIPPTRAASMRRDPSDYALTATLITDALAFIAGHELGHIVLQSDMPPARTPKEQQVREAAADRFGLQLSMKAGFSPLFAIVTVFPLFASLEQPETAIGEGDHPRTSCRMLSALNIVIRQPRLSGLNDVGWRRLRPQIEATRDSLMSDCPAGD